MHIINRKLQLAVLNYERAKKFIPNDEDLAFNLQLVNIQLTDQDRGDPGTLHLSLGGITADSVYTRYYAVDDVCILPVGIGVIFILFIC